MRGFIDDDAMSSNAIDDLHASQSAFMRGFIDDFLVRLLLVRAPTRVSIRVHARLHR